MADRRDRRRQLKRLIEKVGLDEDREMSRDEAIEVLSDHGIEPGDVIVGAVLAHQRERIGAGVRPGAAATSTAALIAMLARLDGDALRDRARTMVAACAEHGIDPLAFDGEMPQLVSGAVGS